MRTRTRRGGAERLIAALIVFGAFAILPEGSQAVLCDAGTATAEGRRSALKESMRSLWADHVIWSREYIVASLGEDPDQIAIAARLWRNQEDIGALFGAYYGDEAGTHLADLLKRHVLISADVVDWERTGQDKEFRGSDGRWHANAEEIADLLCGLNPLWSRPTLVAMLGDHLALTKKETRSRLRKIKASEDIAVFDEILAQARSMADALSDGIIKQFPEKF